MKILKYIFLLLLLCGIAGFVFIATQPGEYFIVKKKEISTSKDVVFSFINDYENWHIWNIHVDSTVAKELFSEDSKTYTIKTGDESIIYETLQALENDSITQKLTQDNLSHTLTWKFSSTQKGTLVTCEMKGTMTLKQKIFSVLQGGATNYLGEDLEKNLANIERYLTNQLNNYNIKINGLVTKESTLLIKQIDSSSIKKFSSIAVERIPNLVTFCNDNEINSIEKPFVLFHHWNSTNARVPFSICLPVKEEIITSEGSDILGGELFEFRAVKITLIGDYSHLKKAWEEGFKYIQKNKLIEEKEGNYLIVYKIFPTEEKQPSKWITEIYIPVKSETIPSRKPKTNNLQETTTEVQPSSTE